MLYRKKLKLVIATLALWVAPGLAMAQCFGDHKKEDVVMSCAQGTMYDAETKSCVPMTSS